MDSILAARDKEPHCKWNRTDGINEQRIDVSDAELYAAFDSRIGDAIAEHLPFGIPLGVSAAGNERLLAQEHYLIVYGKPDYEPRMHTGIQPG